MPGGLAVYGTGNVAGGAKVLRASVGAGIPLDSPTALAYWTGLTTMVRVKLAWPPLASVAA